MPIPVFEPITPTNVPVTTGGTIFVYPGEYIAGTYYSQAGFAGILKATTLPLGGTLKYTYPEQYVLVPGEAVPASATPTYPDAGWDGANGEIRMDNTDPESPVFYLVVSTGPVTWIKMGSIGF